MPPDEQEPEFNLFAAMRELARQNLELAMELRATAKRLRDDHTEEDKEGGS